MFKLVPIVRQTLKRTFTNIIFLIALYSCGPSGNYPTDSTSQTDTLSNSLAKTTEQKDIVKILFSKLQADSIKTIEIRNYQFDKDTSLTGQSKFLNPSQIKLVCEVVNELKQVDTVTEISDLINSAYYSLFLKFSDGKSKRLDICKGYILKYATILKKTPIKRFSNELSFNEIWIKAIDPPCGCEVIVDGDKIAEIDSIRKKHKIDIIDGLIKKDSADYFLLDLWSSIDSNKEMEFLSVRVKKNDHIKTMTRMYSKDDTLFLSSAPFNSARIINKIGYSEKLYDQFMVIKKCFKGWLFITLKYQGKTYSGWTRNYCSNPYTTCS